jgi:hypothetical protein
VRRVALRLAPAIVAGLLSSVAGAALPAPAAANAFHVTCTQARIANDDPIVFPGRPGASHRHVFFGSRAVRAATSTAALRRAGTTCADRADTASYWAPSLEVHGRMRTGTLTAYYQRAGKPRAAAPPAGLRMIAGDMRSTAPQAMSVTSWQCTGIGRARSGRQQRTVPACGSGQALSAWIRFPDCWNGRALDSSDHRSHVAYSVRGRCPDSHPVGIMKLVVRITWPTRPSGPGVVRLGGGVLPATGMHSDFWNAWDQRALGQLRWDCIVVARACGAVGRAPLPRPVTAPVPPPVDGHEGHGGM